MTRESHVKTDLRSQALPDVSRKTTSTKHDMNASGSNAGNKIYPRQYFELSKTWNTWNKLTIADVYSLRTEPGFGGKSTDFITFTLRNY
jgi:hypothetical protein